MLRQLCGISMALVATVASARAEESESNAVKWGAFFDGYYGYNFNRPDTNSPNVGSTSSAGTIPQFLPPSQNGGFRNFDLYSNQFALNVAALSISKKGKEVSFRADFLVGEATEVFHNTAGASANGSLDDVSKYVGQAVVSYSPQKLSRLTVAFGKMYSHMGLETIYAKDNWNYSRSDLFAVGIPYWHLGASVAYVLIPNKLTTTVFLYNGWNNLTDNNPGKTFGFQAAYTLLPQITLTYNLITGAEGAGNSDYRTVNEINAVYGVTSSFSIGLDAIYGSSNIVNNGNWKAIELLAKWTLNPYYYLSPRVEGYWDPQGITTLSSQTLTEVSLTHGFPLSEGLETRIEGRWDHSSITVFGTNAASGPTHNQVTASASVLYAL